MSKYKIEQLKVLSQFWYWNLNWNWTNDNLIQNFLQDELKTFGQILSIRD